MILLADSGSTKTDWVCVDEQKTLRFQTIGLNPYFVTKEKICDEVGRNFPKEIAKSEVRAVDV